MARTPKATIIILTYNNLGYTRACLDSIINKTQYPNYGVVVVDNDSSDGTREFLQEISSQHDEVQIILNPVNEGFARGNNLGAAAADGDYLIFLNNDTVVTAGWLSKLLHHLQDPEVGLVGPVTNSSANETRISVDYTDLEDMDLFAEAYTKKHAGQVFTVPMLPLLCAGIRRNVFTEIGPLDEQFGQGMFEDDDYARRLTEKGYKILCAEDVFIHHWGSASFSKIGFAEYWHLFHKNRRRFEDKWKTSWVPPRYRDELLDDQLTAMIDALDSFAHQVIDRDQMVVNQKQEIADLKSELSTLHTQIEDIHNSTAWKLVQVLWNIRLRIAPHETIRERGGRFILNLATKAFRQISLWQNKLSPINALKFVAKFGKPLLPKPIADFFRDFSTEYPLVDHSEVILFADAATLPNFPNRVDISKMKNQKRSQKVSLISTTLNEGETVNNWLGSLSLQSRLPDEVIITDGGSKDQTVHLIESFAKENAINIKVIKKSGVNISQGRNIAIQNASHPIIACSDFGCVLDKDWLHNLIIPFEVDETIEVSAGNYKVFEQKVISRLASHFLIKDLELVDPKTFLPSSRSLAMKKSFWAKAGGYPEWLTDAGEDTLFDYQAKSQYARWGFVPQSLVYWQAPDSLAKLIKTFFRYSRGDGEVGLFAHQYRSRLARFLIKITYLGILSLPLILSIIFPGWWTLPFLLGLFGLIVLKFLLDNRRISTSLGVFIYPYTIIREFVAAAQIIGFTIGVINRPAVNQRKINYYWEQCKQILDRFPDRRGIILYPPTHDWGYMFQRPHQIARSFAKRKYLYLFCTNNEITDSVFGFREIEPYLYLCHIPLETFQQIENPIVYIGSAWHRDKLPIFTNPKIVYDHYDDLEVSGGKPEDHEFLMRAADIVIVTSNVLLNSVIKDRPDALLLPNGVDYDRISQYQPVIDVAVPEDWRVIARKEKPIIGYSGALAEWFDYELLATLARSKLDYEFVLIGVDYDGSLQKSGLLTHQNIHWLGMKTMDELFNYVWRFDVGIIPFLVNKITLATSPIKLFEYMACELPIVTTALPECKLYAGIFIAESAEEFLGHLAEAINKKNDQNYLATLKSIAQDNTWDKRVDTIITHLDERHNDTSS